MTEKSVVACTKVAEGELDHSKQLEKIKAFCFARDWIIVGHYSDSEVSTSGSEAMFDAIEATAGDIYAVVFFNRATGPTLYWGVSLFHALYHDPECSFGVNFG